MAQMLSPTEFHRQYEDILSAFRRHLPDPTLRQRVFQQADALFRLCALGVWQYGNAEISPPHVEYYNAIYSQGTPVPSVLYWELVSTVDSYPGFTIPELFEALCRYDRESGKDTAARFVYDFGLVLLLFAAIDGGVNSKEAAFIQSCSDKLESYRRQQGFPSPPRQLVLKDFITEPLAPSSSSNAPTSATATPAASTKEPAQEQATQEKTLEELLAELDELCGLDKVKEEVHSLINLVKVRKLRQENDLPTPPLSLHMVFMGNPGTGKTTVGRLLAGLYRAIGVLSKGQLVEVDRAGLVAGFVGQTALKTSEVIQKALGGILFIDEAYSLVNQEGGNDFGREAIEILLKGMEDHREDLVVIVAGYTELMGKFISSNPGLESRFNKYLYFEDYNADQLMEIFSSMCKKHHYSLSEESQAAASSLFAQLYEERDDNFGNARDVRNVFERAVSRQANRLSKLENPSKENLMALLPEDLIEPEDAP